jgi:gliding motility-associated-like protein
MKKITLLLLFLFFSISGYSQLPLEGFENTTGPDTPPATNWTLGTGNWAVFNNGTGTSVDWNINTTVPYQGVNAAYANRENIGAGNTSEDYLATPAVQIPANGVLHFYTRMFTSGNQGTIYQIKVASAATGSQTNPNDYILAQQWTEDELITPTSNFNVYTEKTVDLSSFAPLGFVYVAFVKVFTQPDGNIGGDRWLVDDVSIDAACLTPTGLTVSAITSNSASLNWTNPNGAGATTWEVIVTPSVGTPITYPAYSGALPFIATGLSPNTTYSYQVRAVCTTGISSPWSVVSANFTTQVAPPVCGGNFVDSGGVSANYGNNANITTTICPTNPGDLVTVTFTSFNTENGVDLLKVYDGNDATAPLLATLSGTALPPAYTASSVTGCLTFVFTSNGTTTAAGWASNVTCAPPPSCRKPTALSSNTLTSNSVTLTWTQPVNPDTSVASAWQVIALPCGSLPPTAGSTGFVSAPTNPFTLTGLTSATCYDIYVRAVCSPTDSSTWAGPVTVTTQLSPPVCGGNFVDTGGLAANYPNNANQTTTICPTNPGDVVTITFTSFNTQAGTDLLKIYDGNDATAPLLATLSGTTLPPSFTSSAATGCLTFVFTSNGTTNAAGWVSNITCAAPPVCRNPTTLTTSAVLSSSVVLNWIQPANPDTSVATTWNVIALPCGSPAPNAATTAYVTATTNPFTLTGLSPTTCYDIYVRAACSVTDFSTWTGPATITTQIAPPVCGGSYLDPGGTGNYANNADSTVTICPVNAGDVVTVTFTSFNTEATWDGLYVFNGNSITAPQIASANGAGNVPGGLAGSYWGTTIPGPFTSTSPDGCLTFRFRSDTSGTFAGWTSNVTCAPPPTCIAPTAITAGTVTSNSVILNWTQSPNPDTSVASAWQVLALPCGSPAPNAASTGFVNATTNPFTLTGLTSATCYDIYVRAVCSPTDSSSWGGPRTITTQVAPPQCGGNFVDAGGATANYPNNSDSTVTICPVNAGDVVTVTFTAFNTEATWDGLYVFNGNSITSPQIASANGAGNVPGGLAGSYWGATIPGPFTSTSPDGCLTFRFRSDGSVNNPGWVSNVTCAPPPTCIAPSAITSNTLTHNSVILSWTQTPNPDTSVASAWEVLALPCGSPLPNASSTGFVSASSNPFTLTGLTSATCYDIYIRAVCSPTDSSTWGGPRTITTLVAPPVCGGNFVDEGGTTANYNNNSNVTTIICPTNPGEIVTVTFTAFNTEVNFDGLYVYDGNTVNAATQIASANPAANVPGGIPGSFWGTTIPGPFTSTSGDGCLTFVFRSDGSVTNPGWVANVTCSPAPSCIRPSQLSATSVTQTSAVLGWNQLPNPDGSVASAWEILVLPAGSPVPTGSGIPTTNPYIANGLTAGTAYVYYVRAICSPTDASEWSPFNFATLPVNDECANATFAIVNQNLNCVQTTHGTLAGATASLPATTCGGAGAANDDVWFTFTATAATHIISFNNVTPATAISYAIYSGSCGSLTQVGCNSGANLIAGTTYYIRVFSTGTIPVFTNFDMCIGTLPCTEAPAFCTGQTVTYANATNVPSLGQIGCLFTSPNPAFFFLQVNQAGPLSYLISQVDTGGTPRDVDYVAWGPFTDLNTACSGVPANPLGQTTPIPTPTTGCPGTLHACSYSTAAQEIMCIPNAQLCEVYVIMITNFSNQAGTVTFTQTNSGGGTTACFPINTFNYPSTYYCQNSPDPTPVLAPSAVAGVYSSTPGLVFVDSGTNTGSATGQINLAASTPGNYVITSTSATTIGGTCSTIPFITTTRTVIITAPASATIAYPNATYCNSITTAQSIVRTGTAGGTYSATPSGLLINAITGEIIPVASAAGLYTVTYTIAATGGCLAYTTQTQVEILASPIIIQPNVTSCDTFTLPTLAVGNYYSAAGGAGTTLDPSIPLTSSQSVYIYAVGTNGCITERTFNVTINTVPAPTYTVTQSTCSSPTGSITITSPTSPGGAPASDLFISEVTDANAGSLTYVEIFNATGASVDLTNYKLKFYTWGTTPTTENLSCDLQLTGTIANNSTNVIKVSGDANITGIVPNQTFASCGGVNNNDNIRLTTSAGVVIDYWGTNDGSTFTPSGQPGYDYRRLNTATLPSATWNSADWTSLDPEDYTNVGSYSYPVSTYQYSLDSGPFQTGTTFNNLAAGDHVLVVKDLATGCFSAPVTITIDPLNPVQAVTTFDYPTPVCQNAASNPMPQNFGTGFTTGGVYSEDASTTGLVFVNTSTGEIDLVNSTTGTHVVNYTVADQPASCLEGGQSSATIVINPVITPIIGFGYTTPICKNAQTTLAPTLAAGFSSLATFSVNPTTGLAINPTTGVIDLANSTPGIYSIIVDVPADPSSTVCRVSATTSPPFVLEIKPVVTLETGFNYDTPFCANTGSELPNLNPGFATGGTFSSTAGLIIDPSTGAIDLTSTPGGYTVTYTASPNTSNCEVATPGTTQVMIIAPVTIELTGGCQSVNYVLTATPVNGSFVPETAGYAWHNAEGVQVGNTQSITVTEVGTYTVTITVDGCSTVSIPFDVDSVFCIIQKGISVNNDGLNDTFDLTGYDVKKLSIFNRLGMKVYSRNNYVNEWGGKSDSGDELPDGTYYFIIDRNNGETKTGWIYINRAQ